MTSIPAKLLVSVATIAGAYALSLDVRKRAQIRELVTRIRNQDSAKWQALPWMHRTAMPSVGLGILFKTSAIRDPESLGLYQNLRFVERKQMGALTLCALAIVFVLIGTSFWGWNW